MRIAKIKSLLIEFYENWSADNVPRLSAALAYYTVFSLAPLLIICIALSGLILGKDAAQGKIIAEFSSLVGPQSAHQIQDMIQAANQPKSGIIAIIFGLIVLIFGAMGVFNELQGGLNTIWDIKPKANAGIKGLIKDRFLSMAMILGIGFLLLVSLILSTVLASIGNFLNHVLPFGEVVALVIAFFVSLGIITLLFAMIFKFLPDTHIAWREVWLGAFVTAVLFTIGKTLLGLYLGHSNVSSTYGAAGSLILILIWVYYSAQILFSGAEFTKLHASQQKA